MRLIVSLTILEYKMDILSQKLAQQAINALGIDNYSLIGIPTNEKEFFDFVKLVKGIDENETIVFYDIDEYPFTYNQFIEKYGEEKDFYEATEYQRLRAAEYPDFKEYLDGIVKGDEAQVQAYIEACKAVKEKYPKPEN